MWFFWQGSDSVAKYVYSNITYFRSVCAVCYDGSVGPFIGAGMP